MYPPIDISTIVDYYVERLIFIYRTQPKARATIAILLKQAVADAMAINLQQAFDINLAIGVQLDTIGKYVGVNRNQQDILDIHYFGFMLAAGGGNPHGMTRASGGVNIDAVFYSASYFGKPNTALSDVAYAFVLKMQIILNHTNMTLGNILTYLNLFLPGFVSVVDNADMTLSYTVSEDAPVSVGILRNFLPKPMGVGINIIKISNRITSDGSQRITSDGTSRVISVA